MIRIQLEKKMDASFKIGPGLLKLLSHVQDEKGYTKALFGTAKGKELEQEKLIMIIDLCTVERLLQKHFSNYPDSKYHGFKTNLDKIENVKKTCDVLN